MTQLQSPAQTPFRNRKRVHSGTPPGTPSEIEDEVTAVDGSEEDSDDDEEEPIADDPPAVPWKSNAKFLGSYLLRRGDRRIQTHTSLVGGRYYAPLETREGFYKKYYAEFVRWFDEWTLNPTYHPSLYLTERYNGEYFRFFIDIDYKWTEDSPPTVLDTLKRVTDSVSWMLGYLDAFPDRGLEVRASKRTDYRRHFVFPQVIVNDRYAAAFGKAVEMHVNNAAKARAAKNAEFPEFADSRDTTLIEFDMQVYQKGSLRMLGSCKRSALEASHAKETDFFYLPIDPTTGERKEYFTYEEFMRHTVLLDEETHDRVESAMNTDDRVVYYPSDDSYSGELYVTTKYIGSGAPVGSQQPRMYAESIYSGPCEVSPSSALHKCLLDHYGEVVASNTGRITHDPTWNSLKIPVDRTTFCPLACREHTSNHAFVTLSKRGMRVMCYSSNEAACRDGGEWIPLKQLPEEVVQMLPAEPVIPISALEEQARLLYPEYFHDGLDVLDGDARHLLILSFSATDHDFAEFVAHTMKDHFVCVDADKQTWYHYEQPLWRFEEAKTKVYKAVEAVLGVYDQAIGWYKTKFTGDKDARADRIKAVLRTKHRISDFAVKTKVMRTLANKFHDVRFEGLLDMNRTLIGFNDGIFDLKKEEFRDGEPSDMVSMTVGYNFPRESNPTYRARLDALLSNMQPEEENLQYLKKQLGSSLSEGNFEELFHIWSGNTCNGKSLLALLLTITLGSDGYLKEDGEICRYPYACAYEPEFLTCEKKTGPAPEIIAARLARIMIGTEPDAGQKIKSNFMKKLTGNDLVSGRLLFSNKIISFTPSFKLILLCNKIPVMDQNDPAVWRRSRVIDFPVTFVDNPRLPYERQIDRTLKSKFTEDIEWRREFMRMMLEWYYDLFVEEGMNNPPMSVLSATSDYQEQSIPIANFWKTCISRADNHMCLECILEQCRDRAQENKDKSFDNYKVKDVQTELEGLGVIIRKQVRCRCGGRRRGVNNVGLSEERMAEIAEKERLEVERMREVANQM